MIPRKRPLIEALGGNGSTIRIFPATQNEQRLAFGPRGAGSCTVLHVVPASRRLDFESLHSLNNDLLLLEPWLVALRAHCCLTRRYRHTVTDACIVTDGVRADWPHLDHAFCALSVLDSVFVGHLPCIPQRLHIYPRRTSQHSEHS